MIRCGIIVGLYRGADSESRSERKKKKQRGEREVREVSDDSQLTRSPVTDTANDVIGNSKQDISDTLLREAVESSSCQRSSAKRRRGFSLHSCSTERFTAGCGRFPRPRPFSRKDTVDFARLKTAPISGRAPYVPSRVSTFLFRQNIRGSCVRKNLFITTMKLHLYLNFDDRISVSPALDPSYRKAC